MEKNKLNLFGDDEEEGDDVVEQLEPFKAEHRFSERKTSKLIELKSKYAYDPRFKIDERFIDDDPDDDDDDNEPKSEVENEKTKNLEILEKVLGKKITKPEPPMEASKKGFAVRSSLLTPRFDPSKEECKVYELEPKSATKRKVVNLDLDEIDRKIEKSKKVRFDVEEKKEKKKVDVGESYYEVQEDLKNTMANTEDFSLGSFLGLEPAGEMDEAKNEVDRRNEEATYEPITDHKYRTRNPFKYDSSESEGEEDDEGQEEAQQSEERDYKVKITIPKDTRPIPQLKPFAGFFFTENDARFEEDLFYTKELVEKTKNNGKERSILMMRALSLRKKSATKNLKTEQKFTKKQKERQKFMRKNRKQMRKRMVFNQRNAKKRSQR